MFNGVRAMPKLLNDLCILIHENCIESANLVNVPNHFIAGSDGRKHVFVNELGKKVSVKLDFK